MTAERGWQRSHPLDDDGYESRNGRVLPTEREYKIALTLHDSPLDLVLGAHER